VPGPGEYRPDATEGITRVDDLPKPNVSIRSRNYRRRPCPRCGHSAYRNGTAHRTLHDETRTKRGCDSNGAKSNDLPANGCSEGYIANDGF
jgi:hypothetical protein